jgi:hypothetical protein
MEIFNKMEISLPSLEKELTRRASRLMPKRTNITFIYNIKEDCILAVSPEKRAMQLVRQYLLLHHKGIYLTITIRQSEFVSEWIKHGIKANFLEIEDPRIHTEHPIVKFHKKNDDISMQNVIASLPAINLVKELMGPCHQMADLEEYKELNALYIDAISDLYPDDISLQDVISKQRNYNKTVIDDEYLRLRKQCIQV